MQLLDTENLSLVPEYSKEPIIIQHHHSSSSITATPVTPTTLKDTTFTNEDFQSFVKTNLTNLKYELKSMAFSIETIMNPWTVIVNESSEIVWPISNDEELDNIEKLLDNRLIRNNQAIILSRSADINISDTIRRIMQQLFTDQFLRQYSYSGFKGKHKFSTLRCCRLLFDSLRKIKKFDAVPDVDIICALSKWMAQATNRIHKKESKSKN
ncbi:unnamed protein product [Macrosiphum euphorbiae]|uniref:DUF4806 domain-containing protein n=1 Tax=Macrosiphum euphorbiae TaxID=13131 RepID=A0AAV0X5G8_9HEMI|nr:unnamed protein product [Macrosiphum euphorbiae]